MFTSILRCCFICWLSPYLFALDFCNLPVWNIRFDKLDFYFLSNLNFTGYNRLKNPVHQTPCFKLENRKNQVEIYRGVSCFSCQNSFHVLLKDQNSQKSIILSKKVNKVTSQQMCYFGLRVITITLRPFKWLLDCL